MTDKFIVANLNDERSSEIASILTNKTAKLILDYLADNDASETQIASELKLPASTVNYNIEKLRKARLIEVKDFHWSPKGNKVNIYKAARKLIVIAPKHARGFEALRGILPAVFIGALLLAILIGVFSQQKYPQNPLDAEQILSQQGKVKTFSSLTELQQFLKENAQNGYGYGYYGRGMLETTALPAAADFGTAKSTAGGAADYSQTNIQVAGVDEADIVKNDDKYIYAVSGNTIFIVEAYPAENAHIVANFTINGSVNSMYLNNNRLIVIGNEYSYYPYPLPLEGGVGILKSGSAEGSAGSATTVAPAQDAMIAEESVAKMGIIAPQIYSPKTFIFVYDISDRSNPVLESNITMNGDYFNSRMIGDYVYTIVNQPIYNFDTIIMPRIAVDEQVRDVLPTNIRYFDVPDNSYIFSTIAALNIENEEVSSETFMMGYSQALYISEDNVYITYLKNLGNKYYYEKTIEIYHSLVSQTAQNMIDEVQESNATYYEKFDKVSQIVQVYSESLSPDARLQFQNDFIAKNDALQETIARETQKTVIHKISIDKDRIEYQSQGEVPGTVLNQFSMDEFEGNFRIATTTQFWLRNGEESHNHVYVLNKDMEVIGKLENLAEGERIYSIRFLGEKAYMVTFKQIDPLFVIDLSSPSNPQVLGFLKIPGVSDYLHPYDEDHVIGIGRDASDEGRIKGMKLSVFDVSDVQNPKELSTYFVGGRGTYSEVLNDHKAFLFSREKKLLVIPVTVYDEWNYKYNGAYVFSLDLENGFKLKGTITHENASQQKLGYADWLATVRRSLYMDDTLYTISQRVIQANDLSSDNLTEIRAVELPVKEYYYPVLY